MLRTCRVFMLLALCCVLFGCGGGAKQTIEDLGNEAGLTGPGDPAGNGSAAQEETARSSSDWEPPIGMLIDVPLELRDEFDEVYDLIVNQGYTALYVVNNLSFEHRRAFIYYTFGLYTDIALNSVLLSMFDGPRGGTTLLAEAIAQQHLAELANTVYVGSHDVHVLKWDTDRTRSELATLVDGIMLAHPADVESGKPEQQGYYDDSPPDEHVKYELHECYPLLDVSAPAAWDGNRGSSGGQPAIVAVFDSGLLREHPELMNRYVNVGLEHPDETQRVVVNFQEVAEENYWEPWEVLGPLDPDPNSPVPPHAGSGHGTAIAGIIVAESNSAGVCGIAPEAKVSPFRMTHVVEDSDGQDGPALSRTLAAIEQCLRAKLDHGHSIVAVNMSYHYGNDDPDLEEGVTQLASHDPLEFEGRIGNMLVVSTDTTNTPNGGPTPKFYYPGAYQIPGVIGVSYLDFDDSVKGETSLDDWDFSRTDLFAPSEWIKTTGIHLPGMESESWYAPEDQPGYEVVKGVSFGIPVVSAVAALTAVEFPASTAEDIEDLLIADGRPIWNFGNGAYRQIDAAFVNRANDAFPDWYYPFRPYTHDFTPAKNHTLLFKHAHPVPLIPGEEELNKIVEFHSTRWPQFEPGGIAWPYDDAEVAHILVWGDAGDPWSTMPQAIFKYRLSPYIYYALARRTGLPGPPEWRKVEDLFEIPDVYIDSSCSNFCRYWAGGGFYLHYWNIDDPPNPQVTLESFGGLPHADEHDIIGEPYELFKAMDSPSTLVATTESEGGTTTYRVYWYKNPGGWAANPIIEDTTPDRLWAFGEIGSCTGIAWFDPGDKRFNIGTLDEMTGSIEWLAPGYYDEDDLAGDFMGAPARIALLSNTHGKPFLAVVGAAQGLIPSMWSFYVEGVRLDWNGDGALTKETIVETEPVAGGVSELADNIHVGVDLEDRLQVIYRYEDSGCVRELYDCKTLSFGNESTI